MTSFIILILAGCFAGILAGLLGLGGATVMVPLYLYYFKLTHAVPSSHQFHIAVGSSLTVIIISSIVASINNYRFKLIEYSVVKRFLPGLLFGISIGTLLSHWINGSILEKLFGLFLMGIVVQLFISKPQNQVNLNPISSYLFHGIAISVGILNALFGIAGGVILVPFFVFMGFSTQKAVATSMFCAIPISIAANLSLNLSFDYSLINWQVVFPTSITSMLFIPIGSKIGRKMSSEWLKKTFAGFLFIIAIDMLISPF